MKIFIIMIVTWQNLCVWKFQRGSRIDSGTRRDDVIGACVRQKQWKLTSFMRCEPLFSSIFFLAPYLCVCAAARASFISYDMCSFQLTVVFIISIWMKGCWKRKNAKQFIVSFIEMAKFVRWSACSVHWALNTDRQTRHVNQRQNKKMISYAWIENVLCSAIGLRTPPWFDRYC